MLCAWLCECSFTVALQEELLLSCDEVKSAGEVVQKAATAFASDVSRSDKREVMKEASRDLLMAVVRLMVIADAVDVSKLLNVSNRVRPFLINWLLWHWD